tara:strand:+ start:212 stop:433 length:222 start_codon:yes stop_codon:yes gene_type:complete
MKRKKILDLTNDKCPMIFVKTKIFIDNTEKGIRKSVLVKGKSNFDSLKKTLLENGHNIISEPLKEGLFKIKIN